MTSSHGSSSLEFAGEVPPGAAPEFGILPEFPFEHTPERIVLSSEEHSHLAAKTPFSDLEGEFASARFGRGRLSLSGTGAPGEVRIRASVAGNPGAVVHLDALVRESWLSRAISSDDPVEAKATLVGELIELAGMAHQSTVKVRIEAD